MAAKEGEGREDGRKGEKKNKKSEEKNEKILKGKTIANERKKENEKNVVRLRQRHDI